MLKLWPDHVNEMVDPPSSQPAETLAANATVAPVTPRIPDGQRIYAVGDIHGHLDLLLRLQQAIDEDMAAHPGFACTEVYLGDYVDRGPQSAGVLDALIARQLSHGAICLSGNHEAVMTQALGSPEAFSRWLGMGGREAVASYLGPRRAHDDITLWQAWRSAVPRAHVAFLEGLRSHYVCGDYAFVHAGLRPGVPLEEQSAEDMMWIRKPFLECREWLGHLVVHGHTPGREPEFLSNRINIDTAAYATGRLTCLVLEGAERFLIAT